MSTDPAVVAAQDAIYQDFGNIVMPRWDVAKAVVARVRPIIEAEVRERIAADIEAAHVMRRVEVEQWPDGFVTAGWVCTFCGDAGHSSTCPNGARDARIARGQS